MLFLAEQHDNLHGRCRQWRVVGSRVCTATARQTEFPMGFGAVSAGRRRADLVQRAARRNNEPRVAMLATWTTYTGQPAGLPSTMSGGSVRVACAAVSV